mgnify:FL=1
MATADAIRVQGVLAAPCSTGRDPRVRRALLAVARGAAHMTFVAAVADYFQHRPGVWVNGITLSHVGGCYAWRSRVSDCRRLGMRIDNRLRTGVDGQTVSEYRYSPIILDSPTPIH